MPSVYIQVLSDLHLETHPTYNDYDFPITASQLALLGDIGRLCDKGFWDFLESQLLRFSVVYFLLGNHEPYHMTWKRACITMKDFAAKAARRHAKGLSGKFVLLNQTRYDVSDTFTVLGCTLFSHISPQQEFAVESRLLDFKEIARWTVDDHNEAHSSNLQWLNSQVEEIQREEPYRKIVILTHHSPTQDTRATRPEHQGSEVTSGFSTDLSAEYCWASTSVVAWAFGHTHYSCHYTDDYGKQVFSNQKGYYLFPQSAFEPERRLAIESDQVVTVTALGKIS